MDLSRAKKVKEYSKDVIADNRIVGHVTTEVFELAAISKGRLSIPTGIKTTDNEARGDIPEFIHDKVGGVDVHMFGGVKPSDCTVTGRMEVRVKRISSTTGNEVRYFLYVNVYPSLAPVTQQVTLARRSEAETINAVYNDRHGPDSNNGNIFITDL